MSCFSANDLQNWFRNSGQGPPDEATRHLDECEKCRSWVAQIARMTCDVSESEFEHEAWRLGNYLIKRRLGAGTTGVVYDAWDEKLLRRVALKVPHYAHIHSRDASRHQWMFLKECRALARVRHPGLVTIFEFSQDDDVFFIAMELVEGLPFRQWLTEFQPERRTILMKFIEVAEALAALHDARLVHCDIKPDNIIISDQGNARLVDLSLAHSLDEPTQTHFEDAPKEWRGLVGTPAYMSPEQMRGQPPDERSDMYGFFVTLYEALCGVRPFRVRGMQALLEAATRGNFVALEDVCDGPNGFADFIRRGLAPMPEQRFSDMHKVSELLSAYVHAGEEELKYE